MRLSLPLPTCHMFPTGGQSLLEYKEVIMATVSHPNTHMRIDFKSTKARLWLVPIGRALFSLIFIFSGMNHFKTGTIGYAASAGVPMPDILVPLSGLMIIFGGLSVLLGFRTRLGALLIVLFLIPVTFIMHAFWNISDSAMAQMQMINFMKNIGLLGGAMLLSFYGAGPISVDHARGKKHH